jgi:hypothetical protein
VLPPGGSQLPVVAPLSTVALPGETHATGGKEYSQTGSTGSPLSCPQLHHLHPGMDGKGDLGGYYITKALYKWALPVPFEIYKHLIFFFFGSTRAWT